VTDELRARGVALAEFDEGPQRTDEHGIADMGNLRIALFRDPDGNVIPVVAPA
jgi:hypothetical protein